MINIIMNIHCPFANTWMKTCFSSFCIFSRCFPQNCCVINWPCNPEVRLNADQTILVWRQNQWGWHLDCHCPTIDIDMLRPLLLLVREKLVELEHSTVWICLVVSLFWWRSRIFATTHQSQWWLSHLSEKYESQLGWLFKIYGTHRSHLPVTTNQKLSAPSFSFSPRVSTNSTFCRCSWVNPQQRISLVKNESTKELSNEYSAKQLTFLL